MLHFCTNCSHAHTLYRFVAGWGHRLKAHVNMHSYESLFSRARVPSGTWIFADLERLGIEDRQRLQNYSDALTEAGATVLNAPAGYLDRYDYLRTLSERGLNQGNIHRLDEDLSRIRYPAFIRVANDHKGPRSRMLHGEADLRDELDRLESGENMAPEKLVVTEWVDYRNESGLYQVFSAYRVGGKIIPCHLFTGKNWILKKPDLLTEELVREERDYMDGGIRHPELMSYFEVAGIDYGRIDYGMVGNKLHVFEINTNPNFIYKGDPDNPRLENQREKFRRLAQALKDLSLDAKTSKRHIRVPEAVGRPLDRCYLAVRQMRKQRRARRQLRDLDRSLDIPLV